MATVFFIWIIRFWIRLKWKRYLIQSKSKKLLIGLSGLLDSKIRILYTTAVVYNSSSVERIEDFCDPNPVQYFQ